MTQSILTGFFSIDSTNHGFCYACVSRVGKVANGRFPVTITVYSDENMSTLIQERDDILIDFITANETPELVSIRALQHFQLSLAPEMTINKTVT
ncbi:TPA: hypothetical protein L9A94_002756 [Klebsiella pneumoniae]|nr:hypothetical protein [Klebsiella pneumoniae]